MTDTTAYSRYLANGRDFIDEARIARALEEGAKADAGRVRDVLAKSLELKRLEPEETAVLLGVRDPALWEEIFQAAGEVRMRVYGPRVVIFAPLYCSSMCVNSCLYCAFRRENDEHERRQLSLEDIRREAEALIRGGHKRLIMVFGEHPTSGIDYMVDAINAIYGVKIGGNAIRRVNINAAPMPVADLARLKEAGIGTYQVFQETYHRETYERVHPRGPKSDFRKRLYALHLAQEAGIDDVAIGALFGLADWRFDVMGLILHAIDLERCFGGVGPHTISFPRLWPAAGSELSRSSPNLVSDEDFLRLVATIRLSVPYTGMIVTARERAEIRRRAFEIGCTQTDASTRIGVGAYSEGTSEQNIARQQFMLGDIRGLDELTRELSEMGFLTSFCTSGYRCGRTGSFFMDIAKAGKIHSFCMPNAALTLMEYLLDFASEETRAAGLKVIEARMGSIPEAVRPMVEEKLERIRNGERDIPI